MIDGPATELPWLWAALVAYALATFAAFRAVAPLITVPAGAPALHGQEKRVIALLLAGIVLLVICMTERWVRIGHGPFVNLFELIISQLFSLGLIYTVFYWRVPSLRASAVVVLPALWVLGLWVLALEPEAVPNPPTYFNNWKWAHVGFGKVFLGFCLIGTGLAGIMLLRRTRMFEPWFRHMAPDEVIDIHAWRFMLLALVFESLMLIAGAVWAQDAWGRYWAWDALETSAFINWLALGGAIHARFTYKIPPRVGAVVIIGIFVFAFFTYFGTPFYSDAAHKGVI